MLGRPICLRAISGCASGISWSLDATHLRYGSPSLGWQTRPCLNSAVDFAAMTDIDNQNQQAIVARQLETDHRERPKKIAAFSRLFRFVSQSRPKLRAGKREGSSLSYRPRARGRGKFRDLGGAAHHPSGQSTLLPLSANGRNSVSLQD